MTNLGQNTPLAGWQSIFHQILREHGLTDLHGVDLLRLVHQIANSYENIASEHMRESGLSEPRWRLLMRLLIAERLGSPALYPTQLSKTQHVSKNTISTHLRTLEDDGLIERELDPEDRRQFRIRLSPAGRALVLQATPQFVTLLNRLAGGLSSEEVDHLQQLLQKLHESMLTHGFDREKCDRQQRDE
jgi:DNA-binding MarR family transcriptional regulator